MAERTESSITIDAAPADVMDVIADFEAYPEWTGAVKQVEVRSSGSERPRQGGLVQARRRARSRTSTPSPTPGRRQQEVRWSLVEAEQIVKTMDGAYLLEDNGDGSTTVTYQLVVDVKIPMLGMIKRKAEKVIIDTALKELKKRVEG